METVRVCKIPVDYLYCEKLSAKCANCKHAESCDYPWIAHIWEEDNDKWGEDALLGVCLPIILKSQMRQGHFITITGKYDFCMFNVPFQLGMKSNYVIVSDIFVSEDARGKHLATKLLNYLMETYDRDIFAKCVRDSSAETFWKHIGKQVDANSTSADPNHSWYQKRPGKRDLGWFVVENKHKKHLPVDLFV